MEVPVTSPGITRGERKRREKEFVQAYRSKEHDENAKRQEERLRRAYTRRLRVKFAKQEKEKQRAATRAQILRNKNILRKEKCRTQSEQDHHRRIVREVNIKKRHELRLEKRQQAATQALTQYPTTEHRNTGNSSTQSCVSPARTIVASSAAGFVSSRHRSPQTSPLNRQRLLRRRISKSPKNARRAQASQKWIQNYRRREREAKAKAAAIAKRRQENVAHREQMREIREKEKQRISEKKSKQIVLDKQIELMASDITFEQRYGIGNPTPSMIGANTKWDQWEQDIAKFDAMENNVMNQQHVGDWSQPLSSYVDLGGQLQPKQNYDAVSVWELMSKAK